MRKAVCKMIRRSLGTRIQGLVCTQEVTEKSDPMADLEEVVGTECCVVRWLRSHRCRIPLLWLPCHGSSGVSSKKRGECRICHNL